MKALRISTALSIALIAAASPRCFAAGDPNIDSGVGSAASRGPFGFSSNFDVIYDTPPNAYGVYRDAYGGLRDSGMIPDNLTTRVHEPTWEEAHPPRGPIPHGAPGGLGGFGGLAGLGGLGGLGGFGGFGGLGLTNGGFGLGGIGLGTVGFGGRGRGWGGGGFGGAGFAGSLGGGNFGTASSFSALANLPFAANTGAPVGANGTFPLTTSGIGPEGQIFRSNFGFLGTPGTFYPNTPFTGQRYLGPSSGFVPNATLTERNSTVGNNSTTNVTGFTSSGTIQSTTTANGFPVPVTTGTNGTFTPGTNVTTGTGTTNNGSTFINGTPNNTLFSQTSQFNGNQVTFTQRTVPTIPGSLNVPSATVPGTGSTTATGTGTGTGTSTGTTGVTLFPGNVFNPINAPGSNQIPNTSRTTTVTSNNGFTNTLAPNTLNAVTNSTSFANQQPQGSAGGFATPQTSGSQSSILYTNTPEQGLGGGFANPAQSGSRNSVFYNGSLGTTSVGGGFATPETSGSERSVIFGNPNIAGTTGSGGGFGFNGLGGLGGFSYATGNLGATGGYGTVGGSGGFVVPQSASAEVGGYPSNGSIETTAGDYSYTNAPAMAGTNMAIPTVTGNRIGQTFQGGAGPTPARATPLSGFSGEIPIEGSLNGGPVGTMGQTRPASPTWPDFNNAVNSNDWINSQYSPLAPSDAGVYTPVIPPPAAVPNPSGRKFRRIPGPVSQKPAVEPFGPPCPPTAGLIASNHVQKTELKQAPTKTESIGGGSGFNGGGVKADKNSKVISQRHISHTTNRLRGQLTTELVGFAQPGPVTRVSMVPVPQPNLEPAYPPLAYYAGARVLENRLQTEAGFSGGIGAQGNVSTNLEPRLAMTDLSPCATIGQIIGSVRYESGEILTYGTKGTLRLSADNSGSITFNDGQILTFVKMPACLRAAALQSALFF